MLKQIWSKQGYWFNARVGATDRQTFIGFRGSENGYFRRKIKVDFFVESLEFILLWDM